MNMSFDTRTILDILSLDKNLSKNIMEFIAEEHRLWQNAGKKSKTDFVNSIIPALKDELKQGTIQYTEKAKIPQIAKYINYDKIDYFHFVNEIYSL